MTINDDVAVELSREERRRAQNEKTDALIASGALDEVFAKIDDGQPLTGEEGLLNSLLKATLERGLGAELTEHLGYEAGDREAPSFPNSRNGFTAKTVATEVGDVEAQQVRRRGERERERVRGAERRGQHAAPVARWAGREIRLEAGEREREGV